MRWQARSTWITAAYSQVVVDLHDFVETRPTSPSPSAQGAKGIIEKGKAKCQSLFYKSVLAEVGFGLLLASLVPLKQGAPLALPVFVAIEDTPHKWKRFLGADGHGLATAAWCIIADLCF